jgi:hypothetical protein
MDRLELLAELRKVKDENAEYKQETGQWSKMYHDVLHDNEELNHRISQARHNCNVAIQTNICDKESIEDILRFLKK